MNHTSGRRAALLVVSALVSALTLGSCAPRTTRAVLPSGQTPPRPSGLTLTGQGEGWPPQARNIQNVRTVPYEAVSGALTDDLEAQIRTRLLADARVRETLGERFAYLTTDDLLDKAGDRRARYLSTLFSYTNNTTVRVAVTDALAVGDLEVLPAARYQPAESRDETQVAVRLARVALARQDVSVADLQGAAILAYPRAREPDAATFFGTRVLYVVFARDEDSLPEFYALVDLSSQDVRESGPLEAFSR